MILAVRKIGEHTNVPAVAEVLTSLSRLKRVTPILDSFLPGVADRYSNRNSAELALERAIQRQDVTAYLLLLVQGNTTYRGDVVVGRNNIILRRDAGIIHINRGPRDHERIVGMATHIGGQGLTGLRRVTDPTTWIQPDNWTSVAMWCDPNVETEYQIDYALHLASIAPEDSFVALDPPITKGTKTIIDPATPLVNTQYFRHLSGVTPKGTKMSRADGIATPLPGKTFVSVNSRALNR